MDSSLKRVNAEGNAPHLSSWVAHRHHGGDEEGLVADFAQQHHQTALAEPVPEVCHLDKPRVREPGALPNKQWSSCALARPTLVSTQSLSAPTPRARLY